MVSFHAPCLQHCHQIDSPLYLLLHGHILLFFIQFHGYANIVAEITNEHAKVVSNSIGNFAAAIVYSSAQTQESSIGWPFVTFPFFVHRGLQTNRNIGSPLTALAPIVKPYQKHQWEVYSVRSQGIWMGNEENTGHNDSEELAIGIPSLIHSSREQQQQEDDDDEDVLVPVWQVAPIPQVPSLVNYDLMSNPSLQPALQDMILLKNQAVLASFHGDNRFTSVNTTYAVLVYPVQRKRENAKIRNGSNDTSSVDVVAALMTFIPWQEYLEHLLPSGMAPIDVVIDDGCNSTFTFEVVGPEATFMGEGNLHDGQYSDMVETFALGFSENVTCPYTIYVYPTSELEEQYQTPTPILYTTLVVFVFTLTTMVFLCYDYYVQKHQRQQAAIAMRSNAIISSMFPSKVRKRIMEEAQAQVEAEMGAGKSQGVFGGLLGNNSKLKSFLHEGLKEECYPGAAHDSAPICDKYKAATVLFADIAGKLLPLLVANVSLQVCRVPNTFPWLCFVSN